MSTASHFLVLTALPVEFEAVAARLEGRQAIRNLPGAMTGWIKHRKGGGRHKVTVVELQRGNLDTAAAVPPLLAKLGVEAAFFCGIGMVLKDLAPGDVVAGRTVVAYGPVKEGATQVTHRRTLDADDRLCTMAVDVTHDGRWRRRLPRPVPAPPPTAKVEPIASGESLIKNLDSPTGEMVRKYADECVALDMESWGFMVAVKKQSVPALVVRGISDSGHDKDELDRSGGQARAAAAAAAFLVELISRLAPGSSRPEGQGPNPDEAPPPEPRWPRITLDQLRALRLRNGPIASRLEQSLPDVIAPGDPKLADLITAPPTWLVKASGDVWLLLADLASAYELPASAASALTAAVDRGLRPAARTLATAAFYVHQIDPDLSQELLERARQTDDDPFVEVIASFSAEDYVAVIQHAGGTATEEDSDKILMNSLVAEARVQLGDAEAANSIVRSLRDEFPDRSGLWISAGGLLMRRADAGSRTRDADIAEAVDCFIEARDLRRRWHGDSALPLAMAASAQVDRGQLSSAVQLTEPEPGGDATEWEAAQQPVVELSARALLMSGRLEEATARVDLLRDPHTRAMYQGMLAKRYGGYKDGAIQAFNMALANASTMQQRFASLYHLATLGQDIAAGAAALRKEDPELADQVMAAWHSARGEHDDAIRLLRPLAVYSLVGAEALAHAQLVADQPVESANTLMEAAQRFNAPNLLVEAMDTLGPRYPADVRRVADAAIKNMPRKSDLGQQVRRRLLDLAGREGNWEEVVQIGRSLLVEIGVEEPAADRVRWALVVGLLQRSDRKEAARVMLTPKLLEPADEYQAHVQVEILCKERKGADTATKLVELAEKFAGSESVRAAALQGIYTMGSTEPLEPHKLARLHAETARFFTEHADSEYMKQISVPDDPQEMIDRLGELVPEVDQQLVELERKANSGETPVGLLATALHKPYMLTLIFKGGMLTAFDPGSLVAEQEACRSAIDGDIVIDGSSVYVAAIADGWWTTMLSAFSRVYIADRSVRDMLISRDEAALRSSLSVIRDNDGQIKLMQVSDEQAEAYATRSELALSLALGLRQVPVRSLPHAEGFDIDWAGAWLGNLEVAVQRSMPLLCDDAGLRSVAASMGIKTFSSLALMSVLAERQDERLGRMDEWLDTLVRNAVADLPFSTDRMTRLADESHFMLGPAYWAFNRRQVWRDSEVALKFFEKAVDSCPDDSEMRAAWLRAVLVGTFGVTAARKVQFVVIMALRAWQGGEMKATDLPPLLAATMDCDPSVTRADVVDGLVGQLIQRLGSTGDAGHRASYILGLFSAGTDADRDTAMKRLLR